jgi:hypothetical protein
MKKKYYIQPRVKSIQVSSYLLDLSLDTGGGGSGNPSGEGDEGQAAKRFSVWGSNDDSKYNDDW